MLNVDHSETSLRLDRPHDLARRLRSVLLSLELRAQGQAVQYDRAVVITSPERSQAPPDVDPSADIWHEIADRIIARIERGGPAEWSFAELKSLVRLLEGHASSFVAYALSEPRERVEKARVALGVDPLSGLSKPRPLTAPVDVQLDAWEDRPGEGQEWAFEAWEQIHTPVAIYGLELDAEDAPKHGRWNATETHGVSARRYYEDRTARAEKKDATYPEIAPPFDGDPAGDWLAENDPRLRPDGVATEMDAALAAEGLSLTEAREAFRSSSGRPTAARQHLRSRVGAALGPLWADDGRRDLMAGALGCNRVTLWRLMSKLQHISR